MCVACCRPHSRVMAAPVPTEPEEPSTPTEHDTPTEFQGNLEDFLRMMRSDENHVMVTHKDFNPRLEVDSKEGEKPTPEQQVTVQFISSVEGRWNYEQTLTRREYVRWKVRAKREAGFTMS